jgi:hypothetical protein
MPRCYHCLESIAGSFISIVLARDSKKRVVRPAAPPRVKVIRIDVSNQCGPLQPVLFVWHYVDHEPTGRHLEKFGAVVYVRPDPGDHGLLLRSRLPRRPIAELGKSEKSGASRDKPGQERFRRLNPKLKGFRIGARSDLE